MSSKGSVEAIIEVAKKEVGTIEVHEIMKQNMVSGLVLISSHGANHLFLGVHLHLV